MSIPQSEIVDTVQERIRGGQTSRRKIIKHLPAALRFLLGRHPQTDLVVSEDLTADGPDYVYCPDNYGSFQKCWTSLQSKPVHKLSPDNFSSLVARDYSGSDYALTELTEKRTGRKFLKFIPAIGAGTTLTLWYYEDPGLVSLDMVPTYLTDALIRWLQREMAASDTDDYKRAAKELKEAREDLDAMSQDPGEMIQGRLPDGTLC